MQGAPPPSCLGPILPPEERLWRQIAGYIMRKFNKQERAQAQQVNYVGYYAHPHPHYNNYAQYDYTVSSYPGEIEELQGNGEGPSE